MSSIPQKMLYQGLDVENVDSDNSTGIVITTSDPLVESLAPILSRVRTDVFWQVKNGGSPWCVKNPLREANLFNHVRGGARCGVAPICPGTSVTKVGLLDFDSHKGETSWADMKVVVMKVINKLQNSGGSPIPFRSSGGKGVHLYLCCAAPLIQQSQRLDDHASCG